MRPKDNKMSTKSKILWILMLIGFMFMEFPGIFFYWDKADPYIFGFPFIYGWNLIWWAYFVVVILWAYLSDWGEKASEERKKKGGEAK